MKKIKIIVQKTNPKLYDKPEENNSRSKCKIKFFAHGACMDIGNFDEPVRIIMAHAENADNLIDLLIQKKNELIDIIKDDFDF